MHLQIRPTHPGGLQKIHSIWANTGYDVRPETLIYEGYNVALLLRWMQADFIQK